MTQEQFQNYLETCHRDVIEKQRQLIETYQLNKYTNYKFSQAQETIIFTGSGLHTRTFNVLCIGSWKIKDEAWLWAWANKSFNERIQKKAEVLKELEKKTGFEVFVKEGCRCEQTVANDLAYISTHYIKAMGIYRIDIEDGYAFMALQSIKA